MKFHVPSEREVESFTYKSISLIYRKLIEMNTSRTQRNVPKSNNSLYSTSGWQIFLDFQLTRFVEFINHFFPLLNVCSTALRKKVRMSIFIGKKSLFDRFWNLFWNVSLFEVFYLDFIFVTEDTKSLRGKNLAVKICFLLTCHKVNSIEGWIKTFFEKSRFDCKKKLFFRLNSNSFIKFISKEASVDFNQLKTFSEAFSTPK